MKRSWHKNPANYQPDDRDCIPAWFLSFLITILVYLVFECFFWDSAGELAIEKEKNRLHTGYSDYQHFTEENQ